MWWREKIRTIEVNANNIKFEQQRQRFLWYSFFHMLGNTCKKVSRIFQITFYHCGRMDTFKAFSMFGLMINMLCWVSFIYLNMVNKNLQKLVIKSWSTMPTIFICILKKNWQKFHVEIGKENTKCHIRNNRKTQTRQSFPHNLTLASGLIRQKENLFPKTPI